MDSVNKVVVPVKKFFVEVVTPVTKYPIINLIIVWIVMVNVVNNYNKNWAQVPNIIKFLVTNPVTQGLTVLLYVLSLTSDFGLALISAIVVTVILMLLGTFKESFDLITFTPDVFPACKDVKVSDILANYKGDMSALKARLFSAGVPLNLALTDENAPLIATYLVNQGEMVIGRCGPPM